ERPPSLKTRF
nr:neuropeptide AeaI [Aedes aegypti]